MAHIVAPRIIDSLTLGRTQATAQGNITSFVLSIPRRSPFLSANLSAKRASAISINDLRKAGGFRDVYRSEIEKVFCTLGHSTALISLSAQRSQLGSLYIWDPYDQHVECVDDSAVPQSSVYASSLDAFLLYLREDGWGSFEASLGLVSRRDRGAWRLDSFAIETYDLVKGSAVSRSSLAVKHLVPPPHQNGSPLMRVGGEIGWDEARQACDVRVLDSAYSFPFIKTAQGVAMRQD